MRAGRRRWPAGKQSTTGFPWRIYCLGRFQATSVKSLDGAGKRCEVAHPCRVFPPDTSDRHKSSPGHSDSKMEVRGSDEFLDFIAFVFNTVYGIASLCNLIFNNGCVQNQFEKFLKTEQSASPAFRCREASTERALTSWVQWGVPGQAAWKRCLSPRSGGILVP